VAKGTNLKTKRMTIIKDNYDFGSKKSNVFVRGAATGLAGGVGYAVGAAVGTGMCGPVCGYVGGVIGGTIGAGLGEVAGSDGRRRQTSPSMGSNGGGSW
jgi:hypothetical protein